ncbi:hypothetical protein [Lacisediminimonas sp.]|uniref:hypothetical protein n=1 Tax=Lacisediminimonas sp. TaxID=3060582 RepID=UPI002726AC10|nr:hypothetical protein [Lacisediminimonas sp.]MDO8300311.1 hypothetical protein [Lacisediminimonas sp.]
MPNRIPASTSIGIQRLAPAPTPAKSNAPPSAQKAIDFSKIHNKKKMNGPSFGLGRSISAPLLGAHRPRADASTPNSALKTERRPIPENHRKPRELPTPKVAAEPADKNFLSNVTARLKKKDPADHQYNLLPAPLREGISKKDAARLVDVVLKDPATRTGEEKKFLAKHQQRVDQFECAGTFGARTRNLRSYLEGARTVHAKEIPKDQLVGNRAAELRLSIPAAFRSNISDIKYDLAFSTAIQYGPVKNWRDEDWGDIKYKAQAYEDTGRSLSDYMAGVKAELDKLKAG